MGLAIVQRLANLLDHPVTLRSCPEKGSSFGLLIPIEHPISKGTEINTIREAQTTHPSPPSSTNLVGCRLLLVEDDELVRDSYERLLTLWGCDVSSHPTAAGALVLMRACEWTPQIIISDYLLGEGTNGLELIAAIRHHVGTPVPAALITGNTEDPGLRHCHDRSTRVIFKPVKPAMLMSTLLELLSD